MARRKRWIGSKRRCGRAASAYSPESITPTGAAAVGENLRPTELLIFGNPKAGTPLMQAQQTIGIDLPLKALVWQDALGAVRLSYDDPRWLAQRHGLGTKGAEAVARMLALLKTLAGEAAPPP